VRNSRGATLQISPLNLSWLIVQRRSGVRNSRGATLQISPLNNNVLFKSTNYLINSSCILVLL